MYKPIQNEYNKFSNAWRKLNFYIKCFTSESLLSFIAHHNRQILLHSHLDCINCLYQLMIFFF